MTFDWSIKITKTTNGYIIEPIGDSEGNTMVVEEKSSEYEVRDEQVAFAKVYYHLKDFFNINNDKHAYEGKGQYMTLKVDNSEYN